MPKVGETLRVWMPGGVERLCKVLAFDPNGDMVKVRWVEYGHLPDEWVPARWFE